ncbi:MAG: hypothetical protein WBV31_09680 [Terriglobales bacterium]|jgi:hypothetical protein
MISPISGAQASSQVSELAARQPQPQTQTPSTSGLPEDKVTIKSADVDHDGDSH